MFTFRALKRQIKLLLKNFRDSLLYRFTRVNVIVRNPRKIAFVCKGNICRSAFAGQLMKKYAGISFVSIASCGLEANFQETPPLNAKITANNFGVSLNDHLSLAWDYCGLEDTDLIVAMEFWHYQRLVEYLPLKKANIKLLRDFAPFPGCLLCNVYDPYGQGLATFEKCFRQIEKYMVCMYKQLY